MTHARSIRATLLLAMASAGCAGSDEQKAGAVPPAALATAPDEFFEADSGVRLRFRQAGVGEPVVLLHGFAASLEALASLGDSLSADHRVIALDLRGHGRSSVPSDPDAYGHEMGEDVVRLLDHIGVARAHLVGHSMGAVVSAYVATRHPDRVATATLIAPPFFEDSSVAAATLAPIVAELDSGGGFLAFIDRFIPEVPDSIASGMSAEMVSAHDRAMLVGVMRTFPELGVGRAGVSAASVPALIVVGTLDTLRVEDRALAAWWPSARFIEVEDADHVSVFGHPATLAAVRERVGAVTGRR
jgi:pimeloyl-ACP methyl ester carboxylesterase